MNQYTQGSNIPGAAPKSIGETMILTEESLSGCRDINITLFKTMRAFLIKAPPVLTKEGVLGNMRLNCGQNFVYSDYEEFMGK